MLQMVQAQCLELARRHWASLDPEKYILVHFTKARKKHNSTCSLILLNTSIHLSHSARVLSVILDKKT